jgi:hypothetical protein
VSAWSSSVAFGKYVDLCGKCQAIVAPSFSSAHADLKVGATVKVFSERNTSLHYHCDAVEAAGREPAGEQRGGKEHERRAAIKEISGQALLAEIAKNDRNENLLIALLLISGLVPAAYIGSVFAKGFAESMNTSGPLVHVAAAWPQFSGNSLTPLELFASWKIW